ncbi:MAG: hypothetical protein ACTSVV_19495 [Promethearchaeota archaeon]
MEIKKIIKSLLSPSFYNILFGSNTSFTFNKSLYYDKTYPNYKADSNSIVGCKKHFKLCEASRKTSEKLGKYVKTANLRENMFDSPYTIFEAKKDMMIIGNDPGGYDIRIENVIPNKRKYIHPCYFIPETFTMKEILNLKNEMQMLQELVQKINSKVLKHHLFTYLYFLINKNWDDFYNLVSRTYFTDSCKCYAGGKTFSRIMRENCINYVLKKEIETISPEIIIIHGWDTFKNIKRTLNLKKFKDIGIIPHIKRNSKRIIRKIEHSPLSNLDPNLSCIIQVPHCSKQSFRNYDNWIFSGVPKILRDYKII